jgi:leader peptidase (prepilin peptidase)/N-methyltransferase
MSWLCLGGRCRTCGARISLRYLLVEVGSAAIAAALAWWIAS